MHCWWLLPIANCHSNLQKNGKIGPHGCAPPPHSTCVACPRPRIPIVFGERRRSTSWRQREFSGKGDARRRLTVAMTSLLQVKSPVRPLMHDCRQMIREHLKAFGFAPIAPAPRVDCSGRSTPHISGWATFRCPARSSAAGQPPAAGCMSPTAR